MVNLDKIRQYIDKARQDVLNKIADDDNGALLFMGEAQDPIPRTLIIDPALNAIDVRVWMLLRISMINPVKPGKLPTQKKLAQMIQCSETTIGNSMQVLRLNRWLTLCERVRDERHMNRGNIYAIHTEPMTIVDTLQLDTQYLDFVHQSLKSKVQHIKNNAMAAQIAFFEQINNGEESFKRTQIEQHNARLEALQPISDSVSTTYNNDYQYYAHTASHKEIEVNSDEDIFNKKEGLTVHNQDINSPNPSFWGQEKLLAPETGVRGKNTDPKNWGQRDVAQPCDSSLTPDSGVKDDGCSSSHIYIYKRLSNTTTTTTDQEDCEKNLKDLDKLQKLLSDFEYPMAKSIFMSIPDPALRQDVLDQVLGRL